MQPEIRVFDITNQETIGRKFYIPIICAQKVDGYFNFRDQVLTFILFVRPGFSNDKVIMSPDDLPDPAGPQPEDEI